MKNLYKNAVKTGVYCSILFFMFICLLAVMGRMGIDLAHVVFTVSGLHFDYLLLAFFILFSLIIGVFAVLSAPAPIKKIRVASMIGLITAMTTCTINLVVYLAIILFNVLWQVIFKIPQPPGDGDYFLFVIFCLFYVVLTVLFTTTGSTAFFILNKFVRLREV